MGGFLIHRSRLFPFFTINADPLAYIDQQILQVSGFLRRTVEYAGIELLVEGDVGGSAFLDPERMRRVLSNLVLNSRDAMPKGGRVWIRIARENGSIQINCSDNGPGVPQQIVERLFEEFVTHGKKGGTGLGLAIARSIVQAHGGEIRYEPPPAGGAGFVVEIPDRER